MTTAAILSLVVVSALPVSGNTDCPAPERVAALLELQPAAPEHHGRLTRATAGFEVALVAANGEVLASRVLTVQDRCEVLAEAAAVMLRSWHAELSSSSPPAPVLPPRPRPRFAVGVELLGSAAGVRGAPSYGVGAQGRIAGTGPAFGFVSFAWASPRKLELAGGEVRYQRVAPLLGVGGGAELRAGWASVGIDASLALSRLSLEGVGFSNSRGASAVDLGLGAGLQARARTAWIGVFEPYLSARGVFWATRHVASIGDTHTVALPQQEWILAAGVLVPLGGK